jgi:ribose transport system substrate-binding protein
VAFDQKYYVAAFVRQMHNALDRVDIDPVLKVPDRDYDASAQSHHLERVLDRRHDYMGGVIFAGEVHDLRADLQSFCRAARLPVVFTDLEPFEESEYPDNSVYVGYDTGQLGKLAGQCWRDNGWCGTCAESGIPGSSSSRAASTDNDSRNVSGC